MPDAAWAVSVHPPSLSREKGQPPVLTSSNPLSTLHRRFAYARLSQSCLPEPRSGFPQRSPPWLLTTAACGGLRPAPDCRPRRAILHLSYSYASPFGPALLVTQDPLRKSCALLTRDLVLPDRKALAKTSPAGKPGWLAHRSGYYFSDAESDPRITDELAIPDNQRRK